MTIESELCGALWAAWHLTVDDCTPSPNSSAHEWTVTIRDVAHVVWAVPATSRLSVQASVAAWDALDTAGIGVGRVIRTATGMRTATARLSELNEVEVVVRLDPPGRPLDPADPLDQQWWGDMLGHAHRELQSFRYPALGRLVWPSGDDLADMVSAVTRLTVTDQLAYGVLHTDPLPGLFRIDPATGRSAIARWGLPVIGPLVYDVALAVFLAGGQAAGTELLDGYASAGPVSRDELDAALPAMLTLVEATTRLGPDGGVNEDDKPQG